MMTRRSFERRFYDICNKYGLVVFFNDPSITDRDNGYAQGNEVHLGEKYQSVSIYVAVAFHEFAHALINKKREQHVKQYDVNSTWNEEFSAWFWAMKYYEKYFERPFNKQQGLFVLKCLKTHAVNDYAFKNIFKSKEKNNK